MTSNTCETPPVGSGSAGTNISMRIPTAKLFSAKTEVIAPRVLGESLRSQASSSSLNRPLSGSIAQAARGSARLRGVDERVSGGLSSCTAAMLLEAPYQSGYSSFRHAHGSRAAHAGLEVRILTIAVPRPSRSDPSRHGDPAGPRQPVSKPLRSEARPLVEPLRRLSISSFTCGISCACSFASASPNQRSRLLGGPRERQALIGGDRCHADCCQEPRAATRRACRPAATPSVKNGPA